MKTLFTAAIIGLCLTAPATAFGEGRYQIASGNEDAFDSVWVLDTKTGLVRACVALYNDPPQQPFCYPWSEPDK